MEKTISWMLVLLVIASCLSQFTEARTVEFCHKNSDCIRTSCAGSFVLCVNGVCTCEASGTSRDESATVTDAVSTPKCLSSYWCEYTFGIRCEAGTVPVCLHEGTCICVH